MKCTEEIRRHLILEDDFRDKDHLLKELLLYVASFYPTGDPAFHNTVNRSAREKEQNQKCAPYCMLVCMHVAACLVVYGCGCVCVAVCVFLHARVCVLTNSQADTAGQGSWKGRHRRQTLHVRLLQRLHAEGTGPVVEPIGCNSSANVVLTVIHLPAVHLPCQAGLGVPTGSLALEDYPLPPHRRHVAPRDANGAPL